jgi:pimeloyl-ACP methyl ester carboxylesterase
MSELERDTIALIDALDVPDVHLVGHDWGAAVAWATAIGAPTRVRTLTVLSVPHPAAFLRSMVRSAQLLRSSYMFLFQVPRLPEWLFRLPGAAVRVLRSSGLSARAAQRDAALLLDPNAATAALNWYRAMSPIRRPRRSRKPDQNRHSRDSRNGGKPSSRVTVPTAYLWSDKDIALGRKGAELTSRYVTGPYEFRVLPGVSHWIPDEAPEIVAEVVDQQAAAYPPAAG